MCSRWKCWSRPICIFGRTHLLYTHEQWTLNELVYLSSFNSSMAVFYSVQLLVHVYHYRYFQHRRFSMYWAIQIYQHAEPGQIHFYLLEKRGTSKCPRMAIERRAPQPFCFSINFAFCTIINPQTLINCIKTETYKNIVYYCLWYRKWLMCMVTHQILWNCLHHGITFQETAPPLLPLFCYTLHWKTRIKWKTK